VIQGALAGLAMGGVHAVVAVCLTLIARLVRAVNFAQAAVGMAAAFTGAGVIAQGIPVSAAIVIGLATGTLLSGILGWICSVWLAQSTEKARSAVSIAALLLLLSLSYLLFGTNPLAFPPLVSGAAFTVAGVVISNITVVMVFVAVAIAIVTGALLRFTNIGLRLRAIADRPVSAEMLGIRVRTHLVVVWLATGLVVSGAVLLVAPTQTSDAYSLSILVVPAAAAALLAGFSRLWVAVIGGLGIGIVQGVVSMLSGWILMREWFPWLVIVALLLWRQRKEAWDEAR
jgi:branched-chain amino acid transport system permease protein